jgi:hypothetical protein
MQKSRSLTRAFRTKRAPQVIRSRCDRFFFEETMRCRSRKLFFSVVDGDDARIHRSLIDVCAHWQVR